MKGSFLAALLMGSALPAYADVVIENIKPIGQAISIVGEIGPNDFEQFKLKASPLVGKRMVALSSPGGNVFAALQIGEFIRLRGWLTFVFGECDSACALIWLAGTPRMMMSNAKVGFHAASVNGQEKGTGNALVGAYMTKLGLGYEAIYWATTSSPSDIAYLTPRKAKEIGIDVEVVEPDEKQANAQPVAPPMEITPHPVTPQPATPICDKPIWQRSSDTICMEPRADGRDCSGISTELDLFFPLIFDDCFTRPAANAARLQAKYATVKTWDRYIPMSQRYITRTLQACNGCTLDPYRLIAKDHDANGGSNGGSICYFNKTRSDCETTAGEHYQLKAGSIKAFLNIANGADPDVDAGLSAQPPKPPQPNIPPIRQLKPAPITKSMTPDEVAMIVATVLVGGTQCGLKGNDYPLNLAVAKLGQDLVDFKPDGRYAPLVQVKVNKGVEFVRGMGKEKGCEGVRDTLIKFLPDIFAQK